MKLRQQLFFTRLAHHYIAEWLLRLDSSVPIIILVMAFDHIMNRNLHSRVKQLTSREEQRMIPY